MRLLGALVIAALGTAGVLALLVWMNTGGPTAPPAEAERAIAVDVAPPPPPPPRAEPRPPPPRPAEPRPQPRAHTPPPGLTSGLAGVELGLGLAAVAPVGEARSLLGDTQRDLVMTEEAVDARPRRLSCPAAPYPAAARARGVKGHVVLRLLIGTDGAVEKVRLVEADPPGVFEAGATEALQRCRFEPARYQGRPVKVWAEQRVTFKLGAGGLGG